MAGGFIANTRRKTIQLPAMTKPTGGGITTLALPKTGLLSRVYLAIRGSQAVANPTPNAFGKCSIINRCRLGINSGIDIFSTSGPGYHWLLRDQLESEYVDPLADTDARSATAIATFNVDMVLPVALNMRDPIGMIMLQNEATLATLEITWEADTTVGGAGAVVTGTCVPYLEIFTVPTDPNDWPPLDVIHQILEDSQAISAAGAFTYNWPRGNTYLSIGHGSGMGPGGADNFTNYDLRLNQSDHLQNTDTIFLDREFYYQRGRARPAGVILLDFMSSSGLGNYGLTRDLVNSALITDIASVITASAAGTLTTVRRQLVVLR